MKKFWKNGSKIAGIVLALFLAFGLPVASQAACTQAIATQAKTTWMGGGFQKSHTYKIAFYQTAATWNASTAQYSATNEITGTNYTAGGYTLDTFNVLLSGTTAVLDFADEQQTNVTFDQASTCALIYDDTIDNSSCTAADDPWDCCTGSGAGTCSDSVIYIGTFTSVQPSAGTLTVTFPTPDSSTGLVRIAKNIWEWLVSSAYAAQDAIVNLTGLEIKGGVSSSEK